MSRIIYKIKSFFENRTLILIILIIIISLIFILRLFNLQIVNGEEYREKSQTRMLRNESIEASRGEITDRNGVVLATSKLSYNLVMYKVNVDYTEQNKSIATVIDILNKNSDKIYSTFPVNEKYDNFSFDSHNEEIKWKNEMKIDENLNFEGVIQYYINKYSLEDYSYDKRLQIQMIMVKYQANLVGYSLYKSAIIAYDISPESFAQIEEKPDIFGINGVSYPKRYYNYSNLFSHVIGYVSNINSEELKEVDSEEYNINSVIGKNGIEKTLEKYLKGKDGVKKVETDIKGNISSENIATEPEAGNNVTLTLDYRLQKVARDSLISTINGIKEGILTFDKKKVEDTNAGAVVVLDCNTGEVLAMVSYPDYDTNLFVSGISSKDWKEISSNKLYPMINRAIYGTYSPGSTFKMLVGIAGLMSGAITTDEVYYDPGIYPYGHKPKCWLYSDRGATHGYITISGAIKGSCNCYFYEVGRRIGIEKIIEYAKLFGFGEKTGVELLDERLGKIAGENQSEWYLGDTLSAAIGQSSNEFTPIQLANYISSLANGGTLNKVSIIKEIANETEQISNSEIEEYVKKITGVDFKSRNLNIKEEYIKAIKEGMLSVTSETGGTASIVFRNSNIVVAGKTGTAQVSSGTDNGIFVGFAPYDNPKIAVVAIIEHGKEGTYTANVVKPIMEEYFNISTQDKQNEKQPNVVENKIEF